VLLKSALPRHQENPVLAVDPDVNSSPFRWSSRQSIGMIAQEICTVNEVREVADNIYVCSLRTPRIARNVTAGQFLNILLDHGTDPLLRRPFSVYRTDGDFLEIIFNVVGKGTALLRDKRKGDVLDVLGPLGVPFGLGGNDFATALLVGGGLGVAPLPISTVTLKGLGKKVATFLGCRTASQVVTAHLEDLRIATDDGSKGFKGNVVDLLASTFNNVKFDSPKIFACGPTAMLRALAAFAIKQEIPCEVSLEGPMACGIGICQGCPVELAGEEKKFALMCKDGPTFDVRKIKI
jgi:dihydroorotate dehydrogenase electron transfer subunit